MPSILHDVALIQCKDLSGTDERSPFGWILRCDLTVRHLEGLLGYRVNDLAGFGVVV
jgi:hypothetical protein